MKKPKAHKRKVAHKKPKVTPGPLTAPVRQHKKPPHPQHQGAGKAHHKPKVPGGPVVVPAHPKQSRQKKRGLAVGDGWECCSAEALAASLRLAGWPVSDKDVRALHLAAGGSRDTGVSILATLQTAARVGLAGVRPRGFEQCVEYAWIGEQWVMQGAAERDGDADAYVRAAAGCHLEDAHTDQRSALILGADLPGPHAFVTGGGGVWSWGEWHPWSCFDGAVIEEAWRVEWETQ